MTKTSFLAAVVVSLAHTLVGCAPTVTEPPQTAVKAPPDIDVSDYPGNRMRVDGGGGIDTLTTSAHQPWVLDGEALKSVEVVQFEKPPAGYFVVLRDGLETNEERNLTIYSNDAPGYTIILDPKYTWSYKALGTASDGIEKHQFQIVDQKSHRDLAPLQIEDQDDLSVTIRGRLPDVLVYWPAN